MLVAVLGAAGGVIAAMISAWAVLRARRPRKSKLELVDVTVLSDVVVPRGSGPACLPGPAESGQAGQALLEQGIGPSLPHGSGSEDSRGAPGRVGPEKSGEDADGLDVTVVPYGDSVVLDVKLHNRGGRSAVVKRMRLQVLRAARFLLWGEKASALFPSGTYDVELPVPEQTSSVPMIMDLSHVIAPDEAERFLVRLHADVPGLTRFVYLLRLELIYDADDQRVVSPTFSIVCPKSIEMLTPTELEFEVDYRDPHVAKVILDKVECEYPEFVDILASAKIRPQGLQEAFEQAQETLQQLPTLRERLGVRMTGPSQ